MFSDLTEALILHCKSIRAFLTVGSCVLNGKLLMKLKMGLVMLMHQWCACKL